MSPTGSSARSHRQRSSLQPEALGTAPRHLAPFEESHPGAARVRSAGGQRAAGSGDAHTSAPVLNDEEQQDIMGVAIPDVQFDPRDSGTWLAALVTIGILALLGAILLSTITLVTRFLRGTWNP
jgi:hypothetical protein